MNRQLSGLKARSAALLLLAMLSSVKAAMTPTVLTAWLGLLQQHIRETGPMSHMQGSKYFAGMSLAAYNALNGKGGSKIDDNAVVACACHAFLNHHFPHRYTTHDQLIMQQIESLPADVKARSAAVGVFEANKIIASRVADGFDVWPDWQQPTIAPGVWRPIPNLDGSIPLPEFPQWANLKPFLLSDNDVQKVTDRSVAAYKAMGPNGYFQTDKYYADLTITRTRGYSIANAAPPPGGIPTLPAFWADGNSFPAGGTSTACGHWITISMQAMPATWTLAQQAQFFAALTATIFDATIPCFRTKYTVNLWRPFTAIHEGEAGKVTPDSTWQPALGKVPSHPSYPSGHSCISGSAAEVLKAFAGTDDCNLVVTSEGAPGATLIFNKYSDICLSAGASRVLGGLHYQNDCDAGMALGKDVAALTLAKMKVN